MDYSSLRANPGHLTKDLERHDKKTAIEAYVSRFSGAVQPVCRPEGCEGLVVPDRVLEKKKKRKEKEKKRRKEEKDKKDKKKGKNKKHKKKSKEDKEEDKRDKEGEDEDTVEHKGSRQTLKRRSNERNCSNKKKKY